jgi:hypothetical protein
MAVIGCNSDTAGDVSLESLERISSPQASRFSFLPAWRAREKAAGNRSKSQAATVLNPGAGGDKLAPQFDHNLMEAQQ